MLWHALLLVLWVGPSLAQTGPRNGAGTLDLRASAVRHPQEKFQTSAQRYLSRLAPSERRAIRSGTSAMDAAVPWKDWKGAGSLPELTMVQLKDSFLKIRDMRYLPSEQGPPGFLRRNSWLYPDDGCWARAAMMKDNVSQMALPAPHKVFAFGNLSVSTSNTPWGSVSWWYHVVPIVRVGQTPYVYDPSIDPREPLTLLRWLELMGGEAAQIRIAVCDPRTFMPSSKCAEPDPQEEKNSINVQKFYLSYEWERLVEMKRDPIQELGDAPPWPVERRRRLRGSSSRGMSLR